MASTEHHDPPTDPTPTRWTIDDDKGLTGPMLVLDAESNDPLFFTRDHMGEITDAEFAALVQCVRDADRLRQARELAAQVREHQRHDRRREAIAEAEALLDLLVDGGGYG